MASRRRHSSIYQSRIQVGITILFVFLPFLFLFFFSRTYQISQGELFGDLFVSIVRLAIAYCIAVALAWVSAVLFYRGTRGAIVLPIFDVLQSFPTFAALPLATLALGASNATVVLFLVITIIWPIFFSVVSSLKLVRHDWEEAAEIAGLHRWQYVRRFLWPVSVTGLITGSIIGLGEGWEALVATEIIVKIPSGLGGFFQSFASNAVITAFGIFGLLLIIFSVNKLIWLPLLDWSHRTMEE